MGRTIRYRFHEVAALRALMHAAWPLRKNGDELYFSHNSLREMQMRVGGGGGGGRESKWCELGCVYFYSNIFRLEKHGFETVFCGLQNLINGGHKFKHCFETRFWVRL